MVHIYKPDFVKHDGGSPIFSVDCHPDGTRLATAGGDQKVKLWNLRSIKEREVEGDPNVPQCLATLGDHFNTVNCVRFSKNGRFLASGSTDTNVFLYEKRAGPGRTAFGSSDAPNVENWVNCQHLRGHLSDVIDIAWAPDDSMLASCSLDNLVIVWNPATGQKVHTLRGHTSFVKGVAWDPIGKYLATQADDKSCIIWRVDDWSVVSKITEPYQSSLGATFSLRLCWSPDGKAVTTCNSYKKPSHTASVLERGDWGSKFDFVGHKGPVVTVRFSPALFRPSGKDASTPHTVIACGSQDCKMTVWATNRPKPVCIVKTCFTQSVVDLCWSPDGYSLIACSTDGTVAVFTFEGAELGDAMSEEATRAYLSEEYGDLRRRVGPILEDPSLLKFTQQTTPMKSPAPPALANGAAAANGRGHSPATAAAADAGPGQAKAPKRIAPQAMGAPAAAATTTTTNGSANATPAPAPAPAPGPPSTAPTASMQTETRCNDGRRRIMPVPQGATAAMPRAGVPSAPAPQRVTPTMIGSSPASGLKRRIEPTATGFDPSGKRALTSHGEFSRGADSRGGHSQGGAMMPHGGGGGGGATVMMLAPSPAGAASLPARETPGTLHCQLDCGEADPFAAAAAAAAADGKDDAIPAGPVMLEARNAERHCDIVCSAAGTTRWTDRCGDSRATHIAGSSAFAAVFFENGCVQLYTPAGRRAMPPLVLPGRAAFVYAKGGQLVAVTGDCSLVVWELGTPGRETETMRVSVAPLLTGPRAPPAPPMVGVRLAKCGSPVAQFADGHAYVFHQGLKCWARVADHSFPRSEFTTRLRLPAAAGGGGGGELHALQVAAARAAVGMGPSALLSGGAPAPRRETGRHLECLLSAAEMMGSQAEYRAWLRAYVRHLAAEGADAQAPLRELCHAMLGPLSARVEGGVDGDWAASVAGLEKRVLLRETVLPALAANRASQRLVGEMDELLEVAEKRAGEKR
jgi:protein HIRA/HIR1